MWLLGNLESSCLKSKAYPSGIRRVWCVSSMKHVPKSWLSLKHTSFLLCFAKTHLPSLPSFPGDGDPRLPLEAANASRGKQVVVFGCQCFQSLEKCICFFKKSLWPGQRPPIQVRQERKGSGRFLHTEHSRQLSTERFIE